MYARIKYKKKGKKRKRKKKRKSTYAYESTKAIHVTIKVLYAYDMKKKSYVGAHHITWVAMSLNFSDT